MRRGLPTGTVTFLFTDLEGSTRLLQKLGDAYPAALAEHRRLIRKAVSAHDGVEVDTQGDAFFFAFSSARDAVAAASAAQGALGASALPVRMGVHTGEPTLTAEGYVGIDVHRAARIAAAGHGGQVLVSQTTRDLVDQELNDLGPHRLKDLSAPERIYQLGSASFPPLRALNRTNLPIPTTAFVGRERELAAVKGLLDRDDVRLLTLTGAGGSGKTRLALQAAAEASDAFPDGVYWVSLASLSDVGLVVERAAQALGATDSLADYISDKRLLCLFDNFEHVVTAAPELAHVLARCPNVKLLVTSRQPLHLSAEREYDVDPLEEDDALRLYRDRAFSQGPEETERAICRRVDYLPLAVELAAARTKALSPEQVLERLEHWWSLLTRGPRDAPDRQQTLGATIEWSYTLLTSAEQGLFARLAVFSGGCTLEAAESVLGADLDSLQSLVEKSLLRLSSERYEMLATIRDYALGKLDEVAEAGDLKRRHAEHYVELAEREEAETPVALRSAETLERLQLEADNVRAAFAWAMTEGFHGLSVRLAIFGVWFRLPLWEWRRMLEAVLEHAPEGTPERMKVLERAGAMAKETGDLPRAQRLSHELLAQAQGAADARAEAAALANLADTALITGELDDARELYERELDVLERLGDRSWITAVRHVYGELELAANRLDDAELLFDQALTEARQQGNERLAAKVLHSRGDLELARGRFEEAADRYRDSAQTARRFRDVRNTIYCLSGLAAVAASRGQVARSGRLWGAAEGIAAESGLALHDRDRIRYEEAIAPLRSRVEFHAAEELGRRDSLDSALDEDASSSRPA